MIKKAASGRDVFAFSLLGSRAIASFAPVWVTSDDLLQKDTDRPQQPPLPLEDQPDTARELTRRWGRFWLRRPRKAA